MLKVRLGNELVKAFKVKRLESDKNETKLVDTSFAQETNFAEAKENSTLKHGNKTLTFLKNTEGKALFEFSNAELKQDFILAPKYYTSAQNVGDDDGIYLFNPDGNQSYPYSELAKVEMKQGNHSSWFHLTFLGAHGKADQGNLTVAVELNSIDDGLRFDVDLMEIPTSPDLTDAKLDVHTY